MRWLPLTPVKLVVWVLSAPEHALVDLGKGVPDQVRDPQSDSLSALAERRTRRAIATDSTRADGYFARANAVGKAALTSALAPASGGRIGNVCDARDHRRVREVAATLRDR